MKTTAIIVEFLIVGFLGIGIIGFSLLLILNVGDLEFMKMEDNKKLIPIGFSLTLLAYAIGVIIYRVLDLVKYVLKIKFLRRISGLSRYLDNITKKESWDYVYYAIYQYGSDNLVEKIEYSTSQLRLYRGIALLMPLLGVIAGVWVMIYHGIKIGVIVLFGCFFISILALIAHRIQYGYFDEAFKTSFKILQKEYGLEEQNEIVNSK